MTSRERAGPDTAGVDPQWIAPGPRASSAAGPTTLVWDSWYRAASPEQRLLLLEQARQQGLLFAHQLPQPDGQPESSECSALLRSLLRGSSPQLEPTAGHAVSLHDTDLDDSQQQALACALGTPDVALILGYPGTGKSRLVAEILRQACHQGLRVLFTAPDCPALDHVLERLAGESTLTVVRCLTERERPGELHPCIKQWTVEGRRQFHLEKTLPAARAAVAAARQAIARTQAMAGLWPLLEALLAEEERLRQEQDQLQSERARLAATPTEELSARESTSPHALAWRDWLVSSDRAVAQIDEQLAALKEEIERVGAHQRQCANDREELAALLEARQGHRWWTGAFWRATMQGNPQPRLEELDAHVREAGERLEQLRRQQEELGSRRGQALDERDREHRRWIAAEEARRTGLDGRLEELSRQLRCLDERWSAAVADATIPIERGPAGVAAARTSWAREVEREQAEVHLRQNWVEALERYTQLLPEQTLAASRLVAAPLTALPAYPARFDLILVEEAQRTSEADLLTLASRGHRLVLIGEPAPEVPIAPPRRLERERAALPVPPFYRLWKLLHASPRHLPGRCRLRGGRLVVTLLTPTPEQEAWLQREPVFDRPEVELSIVAAPGQEPWIAEVSFPGSTTIADARAFLHRELEVLAVHATGLALRWQEDPESVIVELSAGEGQGVKVSLEDGIHECVIRASGPTPPGDSHWYTRAIEFNRAAGWDRQSAERWLESHLGLRDLGRTAVLSQSHRAGPSLSRFLSGLLHGGAWHAVREVALSGRAVEFVPVPTAARPEGRRAEVEPRRGSGGTATLSPRVRSARGGAGLEVELSDPRRPDALPAELRTLLPGSGVVNYLEARAVVQALEALVSDPDSRDACITWQQRRQGACLAASGCCDQARHTRTPSIAVLSLFPAQVELLRLLIQRSAVLAESSVTVEVALPAQFAHRECLIALVSLTRSHSNRAVPFSDHPAELIRALTRPAGRLVLFGDPGTMARRSQWYGTLDHLDERTGPLEQAILGELLIHLADAETPPRPVPVATGRSHTPPRESSGV